MPDDDLRTVLKRLASAYPEKRLDSHSLQVYLDELADIPPALLLQAARRHIRSSVFFPRIAELRRIAEQLSGEANFASLAPPGTDYLELQAAQLDADYFHRDLLSLPAWQQLIRQLDNLGRTCRADELRLRLHHLQQLHAAHQQGDDWPPLPVRLRYRTALPG